MQWNCKQQNYIILYYLNMVPNWRMKIKLSILSRACFRKADSLSDFNKFNWFCMDLLKLGNIHQDLIRSIKILMIWITLLTSQPSSVSPSSLGGWKSLGPRMVLATSVYCGSRLFNKNSLTTFLSTYMKVYAFKYESSP